MPNTPAHHNLFSSLLPHVPLPPPSCAPPTSVMCPSHLPHLPLPPPSSALPTSVMCPSHLLETGETLEMALGVGDQSLHSLLDSIKFHEHLWWVPAQHMLQDWREESWLYSVTNDNTNTPVCATLVFFAFMFHFTTYFKMVSVVTSV